MKLNNKQRRREARPEGGQSDALPGRAREHRHP